MPFPVSLMHAQLIPAEGGNPVTLSNDVTLVGRRRGLCDLVIDRSSVSKIHCLLVKTDGLLFVRDLGSTNGTKVNGQRVTRGALLPGDQLAFAGAKFRVHLGPDGSEPLPVGGHQVTEMIDSVHEQSGDDVDDHSSSESDVRFVSDSEL